MIVFAGGGDEYNGVRTRCCSYKRELYAREMRRSSGLNCDHAGNKNNPVTECRMSFVKRMKTEFLVAWNR